MPDTVEDSVEAAELAAFSRKEAALHAAADAGLPGRFSSFRWGGLRAGMATAEHYGFLNTVEGVTDQSVEALPEMLRNFPDPRRPAIIATFPSPALIDRLLGEGYEPEPAPVRPVAYWRPGTDVRPADVRGDGWRIREVSATAQSTGFLDVLDAGYAASSDVAAFIRAEHALPIIRAFVASRNDQPLAAAAISLHTTGAVIGGAATLPAARGSGAQTALLAHRLRVVETLGVPLAAATVASGTPSLRNLAHLGFTIVERTAWRFVGQ